LAPDCWIDRGVLSAVLDAIGKVMYVIPISRNLLEISPCAFPVNPHIFAGFTKIPEIISV
jgi:hypothetical protein